MAVCGEGRATSRDSSSFNWKRVVNYEGGKDVRLGLALVVSDMRPSDTRKLPKVLGRLLHHVWSTNVGHGASNNGCTAKC